MCSVYTFSSGLDPTGVPVGMRYVQGLVAVAYANQLCSGNSERWTLNTVLNKIFSTRFISARLWAGMFHTHMPLQGHLHPKCALVCQIIWADYLEGPFYKLDAIDPCADLHPASKHFAIHLRHVATDIGLQNFEMNYSFGYGGETDATILQVAIAFAQERDVALFKQALAD